jgi:hypothetical protein
MTLALLALAGCDTLSDDTGTPPGDDSGDTATDPGPSLCETYGFGLEIPFDDVGPYGNLRHDLAEDFEIPLADGSTWRFSEHWSGCESYLFIPDTITRSSADDRSIWNRDLDDLVEGSPRNVHYFFISQQKDEDAEASIADMVERVEDFLADLEPEDATWWAERLHVGGVAAKEMDNWVEGVYLRGIGEYGFGIDRFQKVRGVGSLADVTRYDAAAGSWPFENNMAYFAHEARFFNMEAERQARMDGYEATLVPLWTGEVIEMYADMEVELPSATDMATFDTFEIDVDMRCPDPNSVEQGNCGAWDYLAYLWVQEEDESWTELGRFITTYHREARWVVDVTPMMAHLKDGGTRTFRWEWAPSWNVQPTETRLSLRFSNQGKGYRPVSATRIATGGAFGSTYNDGREPVDVPISSDAAKVELWGLVTGHGAATNQCAEFCNHQHEFTVTSSEYFVEFPEAQVDEGCIDMIEDQMTPNQSGTWWYGRGGWCPGAPVIPFSFDVTGDATPGSDLTVSYRGLFADDTPPDGSGDILLNGWIVVYE